ncbi:FHA domain-containing protein [Streptomyces sp. NPDC088745]|uniref:FHA domain-containing protein n=1 Tax=Streptomyces sp. NPDC088745 TaxID=3365884 RepID=UPI0038110F18
MQIRLTVLAPRSGQSRTAPQGAPAPGAPGAPAASGARVPGAPVPGSPVPGAGPAVCDVLVTAPAGTALAAVASGLAAAVQGPGGPETTGAVVVYAGRERLDAQRCALGEPPLVDGAVLSLQAPADEDAPELSDLTQLQVVAGPDAGGVHLLHGGPIRVGRSADADVPLDDPDVSRLHCTVTLAEDGRVTVADLGSTNGTTLDGREVGRRDVRLAPGALLRVGESALRLAPPGAHGGALPTAPDGEGHLRVPRTPPAPAAGAAAGRYGGGAPHHRVSGRPPADAAPPQAAVPAQGAYGHAGSTPAPGPYDHHNDTPGGPGAPGGHGDASRHTAPAPRSSAPHQGRSPFADAPDRTHGAGRVIDSGDRTARGGPEAQARQEEPRRRGGIGGWARRLAGGREATHDYADEPPAPTAPHAPAAAPAQPAPVPAHAVPDPWPDAAALLLTALQPGPRLWERGPAHPEALVVRLGTADRPAPDGAGLLPSVPVTVSLKEAGSLGLAGPRARLAGLARSVVAQLAALHSPTDLEIVLISADRSRPDEERTREWGWLGWLPHLRPAHGQDCRLLLAYDRDQAAARVAELARRTEEGPLEADAPRTVVVMDGDPGSAGLREAAARLAAHGAAHGIHVLCLAETPAASPLSPVETTYDLACASAPAFRECGAVALLSGDVATAVRVLRTAGGRSAGHGTLGAVDAVSAAWAERFARALTPLRTDAADLGPGGPPGQGRAAGRLSAATLPPTSRLLDELGLARATPASLMARWAAAADDEQVPGATRAWAVLGAGPRGPVCADLALDGPHLLVEGPAGSGRTELLRSAAASLAAAARPDRLGLILVDGAGGERGEGLRPCTELPHVSTHLVASDPVRMREFAQALGAELKRREEVLGGLDFADRHAGRGPEQAVPTVPAARAQGTAQAPVRPGQQEPHIGAQRTGAGDIEAPSTGTLRLRPAAVRERERQARQAEGGPSVLPRLVVLVDDFDALVAPALGSTGRPSAGSVVRALEAVARHGERLGVHLVAASARPDRTADTELARGERLLRVVLDPPPAAPAPEEPAPGRGRLLYPDGSVTPFQGGRVTGRIPRTATQRPTVVPLEWERMGDPPARRPVRELGNGPTDLALLASALDRAARTVNAPSLPPLASPQGAR